MDFHREKLDIYRHTMIERTPMIFILIENRTETRHVRIGC